MTARLAAFAAAFLLVAGRLAEAAGPLPISGTWALAPDPRSPPRPFSCAVSTKIEFGPAGIIEHWRASEFGKDAHMPDGTNTCRITSWTKKGDRIEGTYACSWKGRTPSPSDMDDGDDAGGAERFVIRQISGDRIEYNAAAIFGRCP